MRSLYILAFCVLSTSMGFATETHEDENLQRSDSCEALFGGASSAQAYAQAKANRVLRLSVSEQNSGKNEVFLEHGVATWRKPMPLHYEFLDLIKVVRKSDFDAFFDSNSNSVGENNVGAVDAPILDAGFLDAGDGRDAGIEFEEAGVSAYALLDAPEASPFLEEPWAAIVELKTELAGCPAGQYILQKNAAIGQGTRIIDVFPQGVLLDRGEELLFMRNHQMVGENSVLAFQLTWVSPFELIIDEGAKGLKSGGSKNKKRNKKKRKKRKKRKKKSRKKRRRKK